MLIDPRELMRRIDVRCDEIRRGAFAHPPESYETFMRLVGQHNGLLETRDIVLELSKLKED